MERLSRRTVLLGSAGVAGASLTGAGLVDAAYATFPKIQFFLDKPTYQLGQTMKLRLKAGGAAARSGSASRTARARSGGRPSRTTDARCGLPPPPRRAPGGEHHHEEVRRPALPPGGGLHGRRRRRNAPAGAEDARRDERAGGRLGRSPGCCRGRRGGAPHLRRPGRRLPEPDQDGRAGARRRDDARHLLQGRRRRGGRRERRLQRRGRASGGQAGVVRSADGGVVLARAEHRPEPGGPRGGEQADPAVLQARRAPGRPDPERVPAGQPGGHVRGVHARRDVRHLGLRRASTPTRAGRRPTRAPGSPRTGSTR